MNDGGFVSNDPVNWIDPWGLWQGVAEITASPGFVDRVKESVRTDLDRVVNPSRYGENARADTVGKYAGPAITAGAIGAAGMVRYGATALPHLADIGGGLMPHGTPEGYGMYAGAAKGALDLLLDMWDAWQDNPCP